MSNIFSFLNYVTLFILYGICLYFVFQDFTEIIGFYILFIIHTATTIFLGKEILNLLGKYSFNLANIMTIGSVLLSSIFNFTSFILILLMINNYQTKFDSTRGTPIRLPDKYRNELNKFKTNLLIIFIFSSIVLLSLFYKDEITVPFKNILNSFEINNIVKFIPTIIIIGLSTSIIGLSSNQIYLANDLSNLRQKVLLN